MSKLFKWAFVELPKLRRKCATSTNIDSWFTYCELSQQSSVSVDLYFELFDLENMYEFDDVI